jgi:uncharacterized protein involved in exopolysaccharide biosynthesis
VHRTLEAIFRQPLQLLLLVVALPIIGVAIAYFMIPRTYQTTVTLWALHRVEIIGATGPESNLQATPADTQATALTELLQSRAFALTVAQQSNLAPTLNLDPGVLADPQRLNDALFAEISRHVLVTSQGYNLYTISYANRNSHVAQQVVASVISNFGLESQKFSLAEARHLLDNYNTQLAKAQQDVQAAVAAESKYLLAHPNLIKVDLATDPQYTQLHSQTLQAQTTEQNVQTTIATINQEMAAQGSGSDSIFQVLDPPVANYVPDSRTKNYLVAGGLGLALALLACALYIVILVRRNRTVDTAFELQKASTFPVIMQLPTLAPETVPLLVEHSLL